MEITANATQEVIMGSNVIFTDTAVPGNPSILHREGSGIVKLRGICNCQNRARFRVFFGANIAVPPEGTVGEISLAISIDGEPVESSRMIVTPTEEGAYFNVAGSVFLDVPKGVSYTIGVTNSNGPAINVRNANLIVERVA